MSRLVLFILGAFLALTIAQENAEGPIVNAPVGKVRGSLFKSRLGRTIFAYRGVRYGEPPVGQRRFQVPVPIADWDDVFDATQEGPSCPTLSNTTISEDCLRLNVYTTELPTENAIDENFKGRPVMVFIHPGGYFYFSGQSVFFGPEYIMDKDIVLVTLNYRLGTLGFLSTGDSLAPGNNGLKDQVVALRWIQRNIAAFGGDPNSVTICGYSAGSMSVQLHMLSPMSKGLFHRGIAMSASVLLLEGVPTEQTAVAKKQAELLDCPTDSTESMITCFNTKPVEEFTRTIPLFFEYFNEPLLIWTHVVEPEVHGVERFLSAQPDELIRQGKINEVPLIIGITTEELFIIATDVEKQIAQGNVTYFDNLNTNWETLAPLSFLYQRGTPRSREISQEIRRFYFKDEPIGTDNYEQLAKIYTDCLIVFVTRRVAQLFATYSCQPVYFYQFSYQGRYSFDSLNSTTPHGVVHYDDMQYLFFLRFVFPMLNETDPEIPMLERYTSMWTNFAKTGEPIPKDQEIFRDVVWKRFSQEKDNYLDINLNPTMKQGIFPERMQFWERLFPLQQSSCHDNSLNMDDGVCTLV